MANFFAFISRMKWINRWALMRNTTAENLSMHSHEVAVIAHALAVLGNRRLGRQYNADRAATLALYHDAPEILTGDLPTPVKYFNPSIRTAYKTVEQAAAGRLLQTLPEDLRTDYESILCPADAALLPLVHAADKVSALIKCMEELKMGNSEFSKAKDATLQAIHALQLPEAELFLTECIPGYGLTLDELD